MDGPTLCRKVRATRLPGYLYILLLTGQIATRSVVIGLEAGADDYVRKPADEAELLARLAAGRRIVQLEQSLRDANAQIQRLSITDPLVGTYNRRYLNEQLMQEVRAGAAPGRRRCRPSSRTWTSSSPSTTSTATRSAMRCSALRRRGPRRDPRATATGSRAMAARSSWWCCRTRTWPGRPAWRRRSATLCAGSALAHRPGALQLHGEFRRCRAGSRPRTHRRGGRGAAAPGGCRPLSQQARGPQPGHGGGSDQGRTAFRPLSLRSLMSAHASGSSDTAMMPTVTSPKLCFTSGMLPNR